MSMCMSVIYIYIYITSIYIYITSINSRACSYLTISCISVIYVMSKNYASIKSGSFLTHNPASIYLTQRHLQLQLVAPPLCTHLRTRTLSPH